MTHLRLSEKGMRCIGPALGPMQECENCCLDSIKPFITDIPEDNPVYKKIPIQLTHNAYNNHL